MRSLLLLPVLVLVAACADDPEPAPTPTPPAGGAAPADDRQSVAGIVESTPSLSTLGSLMEATGLDSLLRDADQTFTLFAPSDAAFEALDAGALDALRANPEATRDLLRAHLLSTRMLADDVFDGIVIETVAGTEIALDATDDGLTVRDQSGVQAGVVQPDLDTVNGVVHVIDAVLSGPSR